MIDLLSFVLGLLGGIGCVLWANWWTGWSPFVKEAETEGT